MENLNRIMDEKDSLMKKIDELDLSFITIFSQIKKEHSIEGIDELSLEEYPNLTKLKEVVKEVSSTLMTISLMDDKNTGAMKERLEQTKIELRKLKEGKKAYKGYNPSMNGSMLIDEKK
ncbi:Putative FlgN family protein (fragment) [[Clostridium] ultunense Esp]|uniref:FlgN family protein n=2 Tax=Schnuerera ultunensis TaxID=45497 RepID=A0A1M4PMS3_9FIRM